ncbi:hypothetical protein SEA_DEVONTE__25 [Mycobacterium phage Devonte]|nr:hypothetical protein SEA_ABINGHOST_25 [Mycobacterium phage Abinghost]WNM66945.1 hypothetical protein SEA_DEVONTE__25 [Mycobacterium phage Devonte]
MAEQYVTIEGTGTAVILKKGERRQVALTPRVTRLVARGYVQIVEYHGPEADDPQELPDETEQAPEPEVTEAPAKNASADTWRKFVAGPAGIPGVEAEQIAETGRDELIAAWEAYTGAQRGGHS